MNDIKEIYDFVSEAWQFVKTTKAPAQSDNDAWNAIIDKSNDLCREFTEKMAAWMLLLREESIKKGEQS